jgi:hypothetical protein
LLACVAALLLSSCGGGFYWFPRPSINLADLTGAEALGVISSSYSSRAISDDDGYDRLYKLLADGSWAEVEFRNERGFRADIPVDLLHLHRVNEQFIVLVYGDRDDPMEGDVWSSPLEYWSDTFLLDTTTGDMYYLNQIANAGGDDTGTSYGQPSAVFGADDDGRVYYRAATYSHDRFAQKYSEVRSYPGIVRLTPDPLSTALTGVFITADTSPVTTFAVNAAGDVVYHLPDDAVESRLAFVTSDGTRDFYNPGIWIDRLFHGRDRTIYVTTAEGEENRLYALEFISGSPALDLRATATNTSSLAVQDDRIVMVGSSSLLLYSYDDTSVEITFPVEIGVGPTVLTSDRYLFILNSGAGAESDNSTTFAIVVDFDTQTATEFPLDTDRYTINEFRDYPAEADAVFARMTDVLTGTTRSYALYPDGTMELLSKDEEEALIITIEPL